MRYYLLHRKAEYYILPKSPIGIVAHAIFQGAESIASVKANSKAHAHRHLIALAIFHSLKYADSSKNDKSMTKP